MTFPEFINPDNRRQVEKLSDNDYLEFVAQLMMHKPTAARLQRVLTENRQFKKVLKEFD